MLAFRLNFLKTRLNDHFYAWIYKSQITEKLSKKTAILIKWSLIYSQSEIHFSYFQSTIRSDFSKILGNKLSFAIYKSVTLPIIPTGPCSYYRKTDKYLCRIHVKGQTIWEGHSSLCMRDLDKSSIKINFLISHSNMI